MKVRTMPCEDQAWAIPGCSTLRVRQSGRGGNANWGNQQVLPQKSGRQLVDHLSEQVREVEVASEASMERTPYLMAEL
ncbi:hypothetical protein L195_g014745 [Trifolium pratense]|uniref:Uncharacterized protein n=1 Tax=Trifolium pratense TaxID=57577 RepID=A0A2K3PRS4_TRIPR|nr:hypothetical protein L195_g014745 [Trifolium pratense]